MYIFVPNTTLRGEVATYIVGGSNSLATCPQ